MYDLVFNAMESAGVELNSDEPSWMNKKGETVKDDSEAFGLNCTHKLIHPEYVLFVDEVGSNTNKKRQKLW